MPGYAVLLRWAEGLVGPVGAAGVEGTGYYGAGLARFLRARGFRVLEVSRPKRRDQRGLGKSDAIDAELVARAVLAGTAAPARRRARTASWSLSGPSGRRTARRSRPTTRPQTTLSRGVELVRWTP